MVQNKFWVIFLFSLLAGVLTGLAFSSSFFGEFDLAKSIHRHLEVTVVACTFGIILGALFSQMANWALKDKNLFFILPMLYGLSFVATVMLTLLGHRIGRIGLGLGGSCVFCFIALLLSKHLAPKRRE